MAGCEARARSSKGRGSFASSRRNVTRIREPVGCEPMECCPWSSRGEHGKHERGVRDQELLVVNAEGEGRGPFDAKA
jgi:hypothetical protein